MRSEPFVLLVCGGRGYTDRVRLYRELDQAKAYYGRLIIVEGEAPGADRMAGEWADDRGVHCARVKALWEMYGKPAGTKRNSAMLWLRPDAVLAFPGGTGTANMKEQAQRAGVPVYDA